MSVLTNALVTMGMPLLAMVLIEPAAFGAFSLLQLAYALLASGLLSFIAEPWARAARRSGTPDAWRDYSGALVVLAVVAAVVGLVMAALSTSLLPVAWAACIGLAAGTYRTGVRYFQQFNGRWLPVVGADLVAIIVAAAGIVLPVVLGGTVTLAVIVVAWAASLLSCALVSRVPSLPRPARLREWVRVHRSDIVILVRDSAITDAGGIGGQLLTAPALGLTAFGTFRAASNVAAPVRMLVAPMRASIASASSRTLLGPRALVATAGVAVLIGAATCVALVAIGRMHLSLGTLSTLAPLALPVGIFVAATLLLHLYSISARVHGNGRTLLLGRVLQSALILVPVPLAAWLWGLDAAIWVYAIVTSVSASAWLILGLHTGRSQGDAAPAPNG